MTEQFTTRGGGVLSGNINASVTSLTITTPTNLPSSAVFRIKIADEIMKVTAVTPSSGDLVCTVERGDGSTTAVSHSAGALIVEEFTAEALYAFQADTLTSAASTAVTLATAAASAAVAAITLGGDLSGSPSSATVGKVKGAAVGTAGGSLTTGKVLRVTGTSAIDYGAVDLANSAAVTGTLPTANQASQALGGDLSGTTASATVAKANGATIPAAGSLTTGNVPQVSGASALTYGPVNLAGGANYVTGSLPVGNQAAQTLGGDLSGTTASATVAKVNGASIPAAGSLTTGQIPRVTGASSLAYGALDLANTSAVTGTLPTGNQAAQSLGGDLSGTTASGTVAKVNGATVPSAGSLTTGTVLRVTGASALAYGAVDLANTSAVTGTLPAGNQASQTLGGDLSGTTASATVAKVNGTTIPAGGSLTTGQIPRVSGSSALTYGALDLANTSAVTGVLPKGNQGAQDMGGDVTGSTAASVVAKINGATVNTAGGALTTGKVLRVTGASTVDYGAVDLANASAVTGTLPTANQASQSLGGDLSGTTASGTVAKINATTVSTAGGALTTGKVLRVTGSTTADWGAIDLANASAITGILPIANQAAQTLTGDVTGNTGATVVSAISGSTSIPITPNALAWVSGATPSFTQSIAAGTGSANGATFTIKAQTGQAQTGASANTNGGSLILSSGAAGTGGAGAAGTDGTVSLAVGNTPGWTFTPGPTAIPTIGAASTATSVLYTTFGKGSTSGGSGSTGISTTIRAQGGQAATGASNNGGDGGNLILRGGAGGTSGSATAGKGGLVLFQGGLSFQSNTVSSTYTVDTGSATADTVLDLTGNAFTVTLPSVTTSGRRVTFVDADRSAQAQNKTIARAGSALINGATSYLLNRNGQSVTVMSDGTNWFIVEERRAKRAVTAVTSSTYTVLVSDDLITCNRTGTIAITLPSSPGVGDAYQFKDTSGAAVTPTNYITITPASGNVDGAANVKITTNYGALTLTYTGSEWSVT